VGCQAEQGKGALMTDYKALVEDARGFVPILHSGTLIHSLADAVEALVAENAAYKRAKTENDERFMLERDQARAERDALREQARATLHDMNHDAPTHKVYPKVAEMATGLRSI